MRKIIDGIVYDTATSSKIADKLKLSNALWSKSVYSLWKTSNGNYFSLLEKLSLILGRRTGEFIISPRSPADTYDLLHWHQKIDLLRKEFPERVHDS
ncbi:MAG: hypothetical protein ACRESZ_15240 [Methylococcales bacterium]